MRQGKVERKIESGARSDAHAFGNSDPTVDAIRLMLEADTRLPQGIAAPRAAEPTPEPEKPKKRSIVRGRAALPELSQSVKESPVKAARDGVSIRQRLVARVTGFRPTRKQILFALFIGVMVWRPWLIPGILFLLFWIGLIVHLTLGPDRVAELLTPIRQKLAARYPEKAETMRRRAQAGADRLESWIERLPARWRDGIYLPDLGRSEKDGIPEMMKADPFDRLSRGRGA